MARDAVVICGYGKVEREIVSNLAGARDGDDAAATYNLPRVMAFDTKMWLINSIPMPGSAAAVLYGDGENPEVLRSNGVEEPRAIFVSYERHDRVLAATSRLRTSFARAPIYARAQSGREAQELKSAGATEVVVELDELPRSSPYLLMAERRGNGGDDGDGDGDGDDARMRSILNITETAA